MVRLLGTDSVTLKTCTCRCDNTGLIVCDRNVNPGTETKEVLTSDLSV